MLGAQLRWKAPSERDLDQPQGLEHMHLLLLSVNFNNTPRHSLQRLQMTLTLLVKVSEPSYPIRLYVVRDVP